MDAPAVDDVDRVDHQFLWINHGGSNVGLIKRRLLSTIPSFSSPTQQGVSQSQSALHDEAS